MKKSKLVLPLAMLLLVSCGGGGSTPSASTQTSTPTSTTTSTSEVTPIVATIAQARDAAKAVNSNAATASPYEVTGTVTGLVGRSYHIQSGNDAIFVYHGSSTEAFPAQFEVGKKVKVTAYGTNFNGMPQLAYVSKTKYPIKEEVLGPGDTIEPLTVTTLDLSQQDLCSRLVKIEELTYVSGDHVVASSSRNNIIFAKGGVNIYCYIDKNLTDSIEEALKDKLEGFTEGTTKVTFEGNFGYNSTNGGLNIMPTTADSITEEA